MGLCIRLSSLFVVAPTPAGGSVDRIDNRLRAGLDRDALDPNGLLAVAAIAFQGLDLVRERPRQFVERALGSVLLGNVLHVREAASEGHGGHVRRCYLRAEHRLDLVPWPDPVHIPVLEKVFLGLDNIYSFLIEDPIVKISPDITSVILVVQKSVL